MPRRHERLDADPKVLPFVNREERCTGASIATAENKCRFLDSLRSLGMTRSVIPSAVEESAVLRGSAQLRVSA